MMYTYRDHTIRLNLVPGTYCTFNVVIERAGKVVWERGPYTTEGQATEVAQGQIDYLLSQSPVYAPRGKRGEAIPAYVVTCYVCGEAEVLLDEKAGQERARMAWVNDGRGWRHLECNPTLSVRIR